MLKKIRTQIKTEKFQWIYSIILKDIRLVIYTLILGVIGAVLGLVMSVFSQKLIDDIIPSQNESHLKLGLGIVLLLLILKMLNNYVQGFFGILHYKKFNTLLISNFFDKLIYLPKSFYDKNETGALITRMHDSNAIHDIISFVINTLTLNIINILVSVVVMFYYSWSVGIIALFSFPFFLLISHYYKPIMEKRHHDVFVSNGENESNFISSIQGADLIKVENKQNYFSNLNVTTFGRLQNHKFNLSISGLKFGVLSEAVGTLFYFLMLLVAAYQAIWGYITIGEFTATIGISTGMLYPIGTLGNAIIHFQGAKVAFDRMHEVVANTSEFDEESDARKNSLSSIEKISLKDVSFSYSAEKKVLEKVSFSVQKGEMACIYGKNGAGKSTIMSLIAQLYKPNEGAIFFNDINSKEYSIRSIRDKIAFVSQGTKLFNGTILSNIAFSHSLDIMNDAKTFLHENGFDFFFNRLSNKYDTIINENGKNLSGGQIQMISLARALYQRKEVLLVDEPTAALDIEAEDFVLKKIKTFSSDEDGIVILVSHKFKSTELSSKVILIQDKTVFAVNKYDKLLKFKNYYSENYNSQLTNETLV